MFHLVHETWNGRLQQHGFVFFCVYAVATLASGALLYYVAERPFLRWRDTRSRRLPRTYAAKEVTG
jgi:peptidoglycan/LPS O-acetylase OafA/YrhL